MSRSLSSKLIPLVAALALVIAIPQGASAEPHREGRAAHNNVRDDDGHRGHKARHGERRRHFDRSHRRHDKHHRGHRRDYGHHKRHRHGYGRGHRHDRGYHRGHHRGHWGHHRRHHKGHRYHRRHIEGIIVPHVGLHLDLNSGRSRGHISIIK